MVWGNKHFFYGVGHFFQDHEKKHHHQSSMCECQGDDNIRLVKKWKSVCHFKPQSFLKEVHLCGIIWFNGTLHLQSYKLGREIEFQELLCVNNFAINIVKVNICTMTIAVSTII